MTYLLLIAMASFSGTLVAAFLVQVFGKQSQIKIVEEATRTAVAEILTQIRYAVERLEASGARVEESGVRLEESGERVEAASAIVAEDLAASHDRADAIEGSAGAAADAASKSPEK